jgi:hypothetical protein
MAGSRRIPRAHLSTTGTEQKIANVSAEAEQHLKHEFRNLGNEASDTILAAPVEAEINRLERQAATPGWAVDRGVEGCGRGGWRQAGREHDGENGHGEARWCRDGRTSRERRCWRIGADRSSWCNDCSRRKLSGHGFWRDEGTPTSFNIIDPVWIPPSRPFDPHVAFRRRRQPISPQMN